MRSPCTDTKSWTYGHRDRGQGINQIAVTLCEGRILIIPPLEQCGYLPLEKPAS